MESSTTMRVPLLDAAAVARLGVVAAADALEAALAAGLDPEREAPRSSLRVGRGELLVMPSAAAGAAAVKLVTVGPGEPRIQGVCVVFDPATLAPAALVDGVALTALRTAAVSAVVIRRLAPRDSRRLVVFGRGPQGRAHVAAVRALFPAVEHVDVVGRRHPGDLRTRIAAADVICCCTTAREPLFDGSLVAGRACVVAVGSHEPHARELDETLMRRARVVVESRASALREAGDVLLAGLDPASLVGMAELVRGAAPAADAGPHVFKSTGMAWEDAVVATAVARLAGALTSTA